MIEELDKKISEFSEKIIKNYKLCDNCIGRFFKGFYEKLSNEEIGEKIRKRLKIKKDVKPKDCWLCSGLIDEINYFANLVLDSLREYEFDTFVIGTTIDDEILEKEQKILEIFNKNYEPLKNELNRGIGLIIEKELRKKVDFENPDIMVIVDTSFGVVELQIASLYIYGRYKKFVRDIPQTKWFCSICKGKGCKKCNYTGKLYEKSVEELIAKHFLEATKGTDESFHGAGREDIDVRMLGNGRPFVLEIKNPKVRTIDIKEIERKINEDNKNVIEVSDLRYANKDEVQRIKNSSFNKVYRVVFKCKEAINYKKIKKVVCTLQNLKISQLTPTRVTHRRANIVREKAIYNCNLESIEGNIVKMTIETEAGTYVKELITGDNGRTKPSVSELLDMPCEVIELDVIEVKGE